MNRRNNYFSKWRRAVRMYVIYVRYRKQDPYFLLTDVHGHATGYTTKALAAADLYEAKRHGEAYLQRVGPIC